MRADDPDPSKKKSSKSFSLLKPSYFYIDTLHSISFLFVSHVIITAVGLHRSPTSALYSTVKIASVTNWQDQERKKRTPILCLSICCLNLDSPSCFFSCFASLLFLFSGFFHSNKERKPKNRVVILGVLRLCEWNWMALNACHRPMGSTRTTRRIINIRSRRPT